MQIADSSGARLAMVSDKEVSPVRDLRPAISADGARVAVSATFKSGTLFDGEVGEQVIVMDRSGRQLAAFRGYTDPAFLPDGSLVVTGATVNGARRNEGLFVIDRDLRAARRLAPGFETARMPAVSADGQRVAFVQRGEVWSVPVAGGPAQRILRGGDPMFPVWAPDGLHVAASVRAGAAATRTIVIINIKADTMFYVTGGDGRQVLSNNRIVWLR
jgi:Tol biopolymer transport system component